MEIEISAGQTALRLRVDETDHIGRVIAASRNFYEAELLSDLARLVTAPGTAVDVGSNIGNHAIYFAGVLGLGVEAFEPSKVALRLLRENVALNDLSGKVRIHAAVVGASSCAARMVSSVDGNLGATRFSEDPSGDFVQVSLDDLILTERVRILKVDVEGMDFQVLQGAANLIAQHRPVIAVECQTAEEFSEIDDWLRERSYVPAAVYNATDTFIFLPAASESELTALLRFQAHRAMSVQRELRSLRRKIRDLSRRRETVEGGGTPAFPGSTRKEAGKEVTKPAVPAGGRPRGQGL